jgi:hypothetical protein
MCALKIFDVQNIFCSFLEKKVNGTKNLLKYYFLGKVNHSDIWDIICLSNIYSINIIPVQKKNYYKI